MNQACVTYRHWWEWDRFPLKPSWRYDPGDKFNRSQWGFHWLCLSVWTGIGFELGLGATLDDQDFRVQLTVPWLHVRVTVPLFPFCFHQKLWRTKRWEGE